jgi:hypothetical protein
VLHRPVCCLQGQGLDIVLLFFQTCQSKWQGQRQLPAVAACGVPAAGRPWIQGLDLHRLRLLGPRAGRCSDQETCSASGRCYPNSYCHSNNVSNIGHYIQYIVTLYDHDTSNMYIMYNMHWKYCYLSIVSNNVSNNVSSTTYNIALNNVLNYASNIVQ